MIRSIILLLTVLVSSLSAAEDISRTQMRGLERSRPVRVKQSFLKKPIKIKKNIGSGPSIQIPISIWSPLFIAWHGSSANILGVDATNTKNTKLNDQVLSTPIVGIRVNF